MKTSLIISVFCFSAWGCYVQLQDNEVAERQQIHDRALAVYCETNGNMGPDAIMHYKTNYSNVHAAYPNAPSNAVPAEPSVPYFALQEPACYTYKDKDGQEMMTCPGASFEPRHCENPEAAMNTLTEENGNIGAQGERSYTGYYPDLHTLYPDAPANAVPTWPSSPYTELKDPPCYMYKNKRGLMVTECPGAQFEPEHDYR